MSVNAKLANCNIFNNQNVGSLQRLVVVGWVRYTFSKKKKIFVISLLPKLYYNFSENNDRQHIDSSQKSNVLSIFIHLQWMSIQFGTGLDTSTSDRHS